jgi:hypothetical protein
MVFRDVLIHGGQGFVTILMSADRQHPLRNVMIPWVITLLALIGWNALAPEQGRPRKGDILGEIGLSQIADEPELACRAANPEVFAPAKCSPQWMEPGPTWDLVLIAKNRPQCVECVAAGRVRGRAPPAIGEALMA